MWILKDTKVTGNRCSTLPVHTVSLQVIFSLCLMFFVTHQDFFLNGLPVALLIFAAQHLHRLHVASSWKERTLKTPAAFLGRLWLFFTLNSLWRVSSSTLTDWTKTQWWFLPLPTITGGPAQRCNYLAQLPVKYVSRPTEPWQNAAHSCRLVANTLHSISAESEHSVLKTICCKSNKFHKLV